MFSKAWNRAVTVIPVAAIAASGLAFAPKAAEAQTSAPTIGQCVAPATLSSQLQAEGQKIIYSGSKIGSFLNSQNKEYAFQLAVNATSTPDGKIGYLAQQCNDDFGKANGLLKADLKVSNIRLFSDSLKNPLPEMKVASTDQLAYTACKKSTRATCEPHNVVIDKIYASGGHVAYQAYAPATGQIVTISSRDNKNAIIHLTDTSTGASTALASMLDAGYSTFALNVGKKIPVDPTLASVGAPILVAASPK